MRKLLNLVSLFLLFIFLMACTRTNSEVPAANGQSTGGKTTTASVPQCIPEKHDTNAWSYEEIRSVADCILQRAEHPEGPEVGLDGIVDQSINEQLGRFRVMLRGKQVEHWRGVLMSYSLVESKNRAPNYTLGICMNAKNNCRFADVVLSEVTPEQLTTITGGHTDTYVDYGRSGPDLEFGGMIETLDYGGRVSIGNSTFGLLRTP